MNDKLFKGDLTVTTDTTIEYSIIDGSISIHNGAILNAPELHTVKEDVEIHTGATFNADKLTIIEVELRIHKNAKVCLPQLYMVGYGLHVDEGASVDLPRLYLTPSVRIEDSSVCSMPSLSALRDGFITPCGKYIVIDDIISEIISHTSNVYKTRLSNRFPFDYLYIITDGNGTYAYGHTPYIALKALKRRLANRIKAEDYKHLTLSDTLSYDEAMICFYTITDYTCYGVHHAKIYKKQEEFTIAQIIERSKGLYSGQVFENFFKNNVGNNLAK